MPSLARDGYAVTDLVLAEAACEEIAAQLPETHGRRGGVRGVLSMPVVQSLLSDARVKKVLAEHVPEPLVAVKATLFDKTPEANWRVQWHQDRSIAVAERHDVTGWGPWSIKDGVQHVEPPTDVLERMVAMRVHLDEGGALNGPLRVIPGSHRFGKLRDEEIATRVVDRQMMELAVPQGSVVLMKPLLLHSSAPSLDPRHRRVLHVELGPEELEPPLRWNAVLRVPA